jgi:hypothetical protein
MSAGRSTSGGRSCGEEHCGLCSRSAVRSARRCAAAAAGPSFKGNSAAWRASWEAGALPEKGTGPGAPDFMWAHQTRPFHLVRPAKAFSNVRGRPASDALRSVAGQRSDAGIGRGTGTKREACCETVRLVIQTWPDNSAVSTAALRRRPLVETVRNGETFR